jgi:transposase
MQLQTILNRVEKHSSFVYDSARFSGEKCIEVHIRARKGSRPRCSGCGKRRPGYDSPGPPRRWQYVPLWGLMVFLVYTMRRVDCPRCGVVVERVPWASGKQRIATSFGWFLATWAKRLSWKEVATTFMTSWETVYRAVSMAVDWGLRHRNLEGITAIGVDEVAWRKGQTYLTVVYEIAKGSIRLLWIGEGRQRSTMEAFFDWLGPEKTALLQFVCSDMWKGYVSVIAERAGAALHILDRYHLAARTNKALDLVRAKEAKRLAAKGVEPVLRGSRWWFLKRPENLTTGQSASLKELLSYNLQTVRAYLLKEDLQHLWSYKTAYWAGKFLDSWCRKTMRSRIEPMKAIARSLRHHRPLILNWFRARGEISAGAVEGMNNKLKLITRRAYGFRTSKAAMVALYHGLGRLPEPSGTHRFC